MIIAQSEIFPSSFNDPNVAACFLDYINSLSIIGPVLLRIRSDEVSDLTELPSNIFSFIESSAKENSLFLSGLRATSDDLVTRLLDSGLLVAFFDFNPADADILERVLKSFPRLRVGLSISIDRFEADSIQAIVNQYADCAQHFLFRFWRFKKISIKRT